MQTSGSGPLSTGIRRKIGDPRHVPEFSHQGTGSTPPPGVHLSPRRTVHKLCGSASRPKFRLQGQNLHLRQEFSHLGLPPPPPGAQIGVCRTHNRALAVHVPGPGTTRSSRLGQAQPGVPAPRRQCSRICAAVHAGKSSPESRLLHTTEAAARRLPAMTANRSSAPFHRGNTGSSGAVFRGVIRSGPGL